MAGESQQNDKEKHSRNTDNKPQTKKPVNKSSKKGQKHPDAWLCLRFTHLSLNSLGRDITAPSPVISTSNQQVWQCNAHASTSGIRPGMSVNHALMLMPELELLERDTDLEAHKLHELAYWAYRFTSLVGIYNDHTLMLEVGKSINLFKGLEHILNLVSSDLNSFGISAKPGLASTPKAAYVLSFDHCEVNRQCSLSSQTVRQLQQARLAHLDTEPAIIERLHHCGFSTLADIRDIPEAELGQRFGADFLYYLDQLWGRIADPQIAVTPPENFEASVDFAEPIRNLHWINQQLDLLLNDLLRFVTQRQLICRSFTWRLYRENNRLLHTITVGLSARQNTFEMFRELTDLKLASIQLDWEFSSIELSSRQLVPMQLFNDDLFDPLPDHQQFKQLIDKLSNRLGQTALFRVSTAAEHLPELVNDRQHALQETALSQVELKALSPTESKALKDQPLWLLENPQRLAQQHRQPRHEGPLRIIHGPDRITSHWWSKLQSRDYFIARQTNGRLLWIFFDRGEKYWYLHGLFG